VKRKKFLLLSLFVLFMFVSFNIPGHEFKEISCISNTGRGDEISISPGGNNYSAGDVLCVFEERGELRENPSISSRILENLSPGTPVIVKETGDFGWLNVNLTDGREGWINEKFLSSDFKNYLSLEAPVEVVLSSRGSSTAAGVVQTAYSYMGVPYVWGGSSPSGFDCSGFVQWVYARNGVIISRTADTQYMEGVPVKDLQPGDLVFFTTYAPGASHVGIYLACTLFIHASSSGSVRISSLSESYYTSVFLGGRRYFK